MKDQKIRQIIRKQLIKIQENKHLSEKTDWYNIGLDLVGLIPGLGEPADLINMIDYLRKKDYLFAAFSAISMIPEIGDAVGKGGKTLVGLAKGLKKGSAIAKSIVGALRSNRGLIDKIFNGLEESDKVTKDIKSSIPKMKSALDVFMSSAEKSPAEENIAGAVQSIPTIYKSMSENKEDEEDERSKYTDDDWENFYLDKDLAEVAMKFGYLKEKSK